jgi:hypothetical protein
MTSNIRQPRDASHDFDETDSSPSAHEATLTISNVATGDAISIPTIVFVASGDDIGDGDQEGSDVIASILSAEPSIRAAELVELTATDGTMIYYPSVVSVDIGDVFYLRERDSGENGVIVQVINKETASYPQVESKVLWRLLTAVRGHQLQRAHHEPAEVIDQFLMARFKVRASIVSGEWQGAEGRIVTRNVDIFAIDPRVLLKNVLTHDTNTSIYLGEFKNERIMFSGEGFDKINLVTGMKGAGKSHITKGIVDESRRRGMTAVVFDINDEYAELPGATVLRPGNNLKFRMDRVMPNSILEVIGRLAPFAERTSFAARAGIPRIIRDRTAEGKYPDIAFLKKQANTVFTDKASFVDNMISSYNQSLDMLDRFDLFASAQEAADEDQAMKRGVVSTGSTLSSALYDLDKANEAGVLVFSIGGLVPGVQISVVKLVLDTLESICKRQAQWAMADSTHLPIYPTVYFEEAHMYMDPNDINEIIPLIRHLGMNLFFVTNTPCDLPDSVFRLLDNMIVTRLLNERDINQLATCGLADKGTIENFARQLPDRTALLLSGKDRTTKGFPLVFSVRDFGLPASGVTRSMWRYLASSSSNDGDARDE